MLIISKGIPMEYGMTTNKTLMCMTCLSKSSGGILDGSTKKLK